MSFSAFGTKSSFRITCILRHTAVRDAAAKGKIERFFRRVRDQFLVRNLDLSSLGELNRQFTQWVEQEYNATLHTTLGMKLNRVLLQPHWQKEVDLTDF